MVVGVRLVDRAIEVEFLELSIERGEVLEERPILRN